LGDGQEVSVSGTLAGPKHHQKIVAVGEYDVDLALADHMVVLRYEDRPGVVGTVGRVFGEAGINIAGMQVSRSAAGGEALAVLTVDDTVPQEAVNEVAGEIGATSARSVNLVK
ncbi:phosphoglycerate dehydrogenase, partial [Streptomyces dioscori]